MIPIVRLQGVNNVRRKNKMIDFILLKFIVSVCVIFAILYVFSNFSYILNDKSIKVNWRILYFIPFISSAIKINQIEDIKQFEFRKDILSPTQVLGNLFIKKGVILKRKGKFFTYNIYLTPPDPERFIMDIRDVLNERAID